MHARDEKKLVHTPVLKTNLIYTSILHLHIYSMLAFMFSNCPRAGDSEWTRGYYNKYPSSTRRFKFTNLVAIFFFEGWVSVLFCSAHTQNSLVREAIRWNSGHVFKKLETFFVIFKLSRHRSWSFVIAYQAYIICMFKRARLHRAIWFTLAIYIEPYSV